MKVQVKVTGIPDNHVAFVQAECPDTAEPTSTPLAVTNEQVNEIDVPEGSDVRVLFVEDEAHAKTNEYLRTGA